MAKTSPAAEVPVLRDIVAAESNARKQLHQPPGDETLEISETELAVLQTELAAKMHELTDRLLHSAAQEMEALLFEKISATLREQLPELVDDILWNHFQREKR